MSAAKDQEWFCDGVAEEILNALSQLKDLRVAARASAFSFRGKGDDLKTIGDKLQVGTVLDGSVRRSGDQLRITVRLSDVTNGYQLWSERYDRSLSGIFDVQEEIAKAVAARLGTTSDESAAQPHVVRHTENQEAYHLYLRGRHLWYSRSKGSLQVARELFEEAARKDPNYVLPWVGLADLFAIQSLYGFEREEYARPRGAGRREPRARPQRPGGGRPPRPRIFVVVLHRLGPKVGGRSLRAQHRARPDERAVPSSGTPGRHGRAARTRRSRRRAARRSSIRSIHTSTASPALSTISTAAVKRGFGNSTRPSRSIPTISSACISAAAPTPGLAGTTRRCACSRRGVELSGRAPFYLCYHAWALARAGRVEEARAALAELEARAQTRVRAAPAISPSCARRSGRWTARSSCSNVACATTTGGLATPRMPMFENFRRDPRYAEHLRRIGHPDAEWASAIG